MLQHETAGTHFGFYIFFLNIYATEAMIIKIKL